MSKLSVCACPECGGEFVMQAEDVAEVLEVTCPLCEQVFEPPAEEEEEEEGGAEEPEESEGPEVGAEEGTDDDEGHEDEDEGAAEDDQRGWPRRIARLRAKNATGR